MDAAKIETAGSLNSGTLLPNLIFGGACSSIATSPFVEQGTTSAPVFTRARRNSFFGSLFGVDASSETVVYIGVAGESAEETKIRMDAIQNAFEKVQVDAVAK